MDSISAFKVRDAKIRFYFELMAGQDAETTVRGMQLFHNVLCLNSRVVEWPFQ